MTSGKARRTAAMTASLLCAFIAGAVAMRLLGDERVLTAVARVVQIIPGVLEVEQAPSIPAATDLRPLQTFWEVRQKVKECFVYPIVDDKKLTYGAIRGMLAALDDPWTRFYTPEEYQDFQTETEGHFDGIGAVLESRDVGEGGEREVFVTSILPEGPASKVDMRPEDVIVAVDDVPVKGLTLQAVVNRIRGKRGTKVKVELKRQGVAETIKVEIERAEIQFPVVEYKMLDNKIGYVWLRSFNKQADAKLRAALEDLKKQNLRGLVLDLSINGGGLLDMAIAVAGMFVDRGPVVYVQERGVEPEPINPRPGGTILPDIPMVVLVDHGSASASEIVAACLQDKGRALVVGQNTFGKSKVQTVAELNDRSALVLSTAVYLTPKKRDISLEYEEGKRGVKPDVYFPDPDPSARIKYEDWHQQQIAKAVAVLEERIKQSSG